jgi:hypothetical protein
MGYAQPGFPVLGIWNLCQFLKRMMFGREETRREGCRQAELRANFL